MDLADGRTITDFFKRVSDADAVVCCAVSARRFELGGDQIQRVSAILNPDELAHLGPTINLGSLLHRRRSP